MRTWLVFMNLQRPGFVGRWWWWRKAKTLWLTSISWEWLLERVPYMFMYILYLSLSLSLYSWEPWIIDSHFCIVLLLVSLSVISIMIRYSSPCYHHQEEECRLMRKRSFIYSTYAQLQTSFIQHDGRSTVMILSQVSRWTLRFEI